MTQHTCTESTCNVNAKKKTVLAAVSVGVLVVGSIVLMMSSKVSHPQRTEVNAANVRAQNVDRVEQDVHGGIGVGAESVMDDAIDAVVVSDNGTYAAYAPELVGKTPRTILSFSAPWCPSCQAFDKDITARSKEIPDGVTVLKVDYDTETILKKKYNVRTQHTFVEVGMDGAAIKTMIGSRDLAALVSDFSL